MQDRGTEPHAQQKVGNTLYTEVFFSIVKGETVPALLVAALKCQLFSMAVGNRS